MLREALIRPSYASWHLHARSLLASGAAPATIVWSVSPEAPDPSPVSGGRVRIDRRFVERADLAARHRATERWGLLYRLLWRLVHENRKLLDVTTDPDVELLNWMAARVRDDVDRMRTFLRFRTIGDAHQEYFVSWHRPEYDIADLLAPFFAQRYPNIRWSLFTPQRTVHWDGRKITLAPGVPSSELPPEESHAGGEELWRKYFMSGSPGGFRHVRSSSVTYTQPQAGGGYGQRS